MSDNHYECILTPTVSTSSGIGAGDQRERGSGSEDSSDEEPEDSSSSSEQESLETVLAKFREEWKRELQNQPLNPETGNTRNPSFKEEKRTIDEKASLLFQQGEALEQTGRVYDAIHCYKKAIELVPDIEDRTLDNLKSKFHRLRRISEHSQGSVSSGGDIENNNVDFEDLKEEVSDVDDDVTDLVAKFPKQQFISKKICQELYEQKAAHISELPTEILLYILKWVISSDLDLRSLEQFGLVCRGFFLLSRDEELWKLICLRIWGLSCGTPRLHSSWRQMCVERPHLRHDGCYISRTTYVRHGESSFQDQYYRPCHLVEYFRYFRVYPGGECALLTTPDDPVSVVSMLRQQNLRHPHILRGNYRLNGNVLTAVLKRPVQEKRMNFNNRYRSRRPEPAQDQVEQSFRVELEIHNHHNRRNSQLSWHHYSIHSLSKSGHQSVCEFDLSNNKFPCFWFSRVRSYTATAEMPLI